MKDVLIFILFAVIFLAFGTYHVRNFQPRGDEIHYLVTTESIIQDGDLAIENNYTKEFLAKYEIETIDQHGVEGRGGHQYLFHGLGLVSVIIIPAYMLAGWTGTVYFLALFYSLFLWVSYKASIALTKNSLASFLAVLVAGMSIPLASFAPYIFPGIFGGLIVAYTVYLLAKGEDTKLLYIVLGLLPFIHIRLITLAAGLWVVSIWYFKLSKKALMTPFLIILYFFAHFAVFESFNPDVPYQRANLPSQTGNLLQNLVLVLTDKQYGLLTNAPVYLLGIAGVLLMKPKLKWGIIFATLIYCYKTFSFMDWHGGYAPPARYLVILLPFLVVGIAKLLSSRRLFSWFAFVGFGVVSVWFWILSRTLTYGGFLYMDGINEVLRYVSERYTLNFYETLPSFYPSGEFTLGHTKLLLVYLVIITVLWISGKKKGIAD